MCKYSGNLFCGFTPLWFCVLWFLWFWLGAHGGEGDMLFPTVLRILGSGHYIFVFLPYNGCCPK